MTTQTKSRQRFHAVSIVAGPNACAQAKMLKDMRLLSVEAPRLPVVGCEKAEGCTCKFEHHADRRAGPRRSGLRNMDNLIGAHAINRRRMLGRRDTDYADD